MTLHISPTRDGSLLKASDKSLYWEQPTPRDSNSNTHRRNGCLWIVVVCGLELFHSFREVGFFSFLLIFAFISVLVLFFHKFEF